MVTKPTKNNYRQYYKEYYGINFGDNYAVHHIDGNRNNNNIENLLLLPKSLHSNFHLTSLFYKDAYELFSPDLKSVLPNGLHYGQEKFKQYIDSVVDIQKWVYYKEFRYRSEEISGLNLKEWM